MDALARLFLTYLVHSTVLLGGAWIACRVLGERRLALQEALLRAALVGGFATAALQVGLDVEPLGGVLRLPAAAPAEGAEWAAVPPPAALAHGEAPLGAPAAAGPVRPRPRAFVMVPAEPTWAERASVTAGRLGANRWREGLALAWLSLAAVALARLAVASRRLSRLLRDREALPSGALAPQVEAVGSALGLRAPLRISAAPRLCVPLATGVLRPEVCLPKRAVVELGPDEQVALCAHELAHVRRRDPAWILAARLGESVAPLQPLNTWARRRLQDVAECLSDDLSVSVSARPLGLARSLVDVASWTLDEPALLPAAAAGALAARSRLGHRVERLMDPVRRLERPRRFLLPAAAAVVLATALVTPVVSGSARDPEPAPAPVMPPPAAAPEAARPAPRARAQAQDRSAPEERAAADEARRKAAERLEEIGRRIEERATLHEGEIRKLEEELQAKFSHFRPDEADMQRLASEIDRAAQELTTATLAGLEPQADRRAPSEAARDAARRMAELQREMRDKAGAMRVPAKEMRALQERLRAVTEQVRPTEEEREELQRLSREVAREAMPDLSELSRHLLEDARRQALESRHASEAAREAMRRAAEELRRAVEQMRTAVDEARQESLAARPRPEPEVKPGAPRP